MAVVEAKVTPRLKTLYLEEIRQQAAKREAELRRAQGRLTELEDDLARERERRGKLEAVLSRGQK